MKRKTRYLRIIFENALVYNPVLIQILGLSPIIAIATTLETALVVAGISAMLVIIMETISSAFLKKVDRYFRVAIYFLISLVLLAPIMLWFENQTEEYMKQMGIILPLLAVSSFVVVRCEKFAVKNTVKASLVDSVASALGYGIVAIVVGAIREMLGKGTLGGAVILETAPLSGFTLPFGGLVLLGFLAAGLSMLVARFFPYYTEDIVFRFKGQKTEKKKTNFEFSVINPDKDREKALDSFTDNLLKGDEE